MTANTNNDSIKPADGDTTTTATTGNTNVQDQEIALARSKGLLVDIRGPEESPVSVAAVTMNALTNASGTSMTKTTTSPTPAAMKELDHWDKVRDDECLLCSDDEDSDDDLL